MSSNFIFCVKESLMIEHSFSNPCLVNLISKDTHLVFSIQWATLVTHQFFRVHIFWQKCWNRTFSMIIYLLTFYLFDNIEKKYWNHSCESFCYSKAILTNFEKCTCKRNVYIFYFCFVLGIIHRDRCDRKTPNTIYLFKQNPFFRSLNLVTLLLFEEMLVLTSY